MGGFFEFRIWGAYIQSGLFLEFYGILHQLRLNCCQVFSKVDTIYQIKNCWQFCKMCFVMFISNSGSFCIFFFFFLYFYYKNKIFLIQLVMKLNIFRLKLCCIYTCPLYFSTLIRTLGRMGNTHKFEKKSSNT